MTVRGDSGGLAAEGEDIEVLEWPLTRALQAYSRWRDHGC